MTTAVPSGADVLRPIFALAAIMSAASIEIEPDQQEDFLSAVKDAAHLSVQDEARCLRFDVLRDDADEARCLLYEACTDEASFQAHLATPHARRALQGSRQCAEAPFEVTRATSIFPLAALCFETTVKGQGSFDIETSQRGP